MPLRPHKPQRVLLDDLDGFAAVGPSPADEVAAILDGDADEEDIDARTAPLVSRLLRVCPALGLAFIEEFGFLRRARQYGVDLTRYKMPSVRELARRAGVHQEEARRAIARATGRPPGQGSVARSRGKGAKPAGLRIPRELTPAPAGSWGHREKSKTGRAKREAHQSKGKRK